MTDIDEKLAALQLEVTANLRDGVHFTSKGIAQVKQVFAEAGYRSFKEIRRARELVDQMVQGIEETNRVPAPTILPGVMAGADWYDRYIANLAHILIIDDDVEAAIALCGEAAKKASGL